tara:strand:- start:5465 stop:5782 length:318 start_codon:yes stop_codon:yes gene_type:complete
MAKTYDDFLAQATTEVESEKPIDIIHNGEKRELTEDEYDDYVKRRASNYWDNYLYSYIDARQVAYGSIGDQLDMLWHDMTADKGDKTGEWYKAIKKVKDDNPKPE